jgi:hypothetical protein
LPDTSHVFDHATHLTVRVLLFALVAATSPPALASVIVVLTSARGRLNGSAFAIGFVTGPAVFCLLAFALGSRDRASPLDHACQGAAPSMRNTSNNTPPTSAKK